MATNRIETLDPALIRPGIINGHVYYNCPLPCVNFTQNSWAKTVCLQIYTLSHIRESVDSLCMDETDLSHNTF